MARHVLILAILTILPDGAEEEERVITAVYRSIEL